MKDSLELVLGDVPVLGLVEVLEVRLAEDPSILDLLAVQEDNLIKLGSLVLTEFEEGSPGWIGGKLVDLLHLVKRVLLDSFLSEDLVDVLTELEVVHQLGPEALLIAGQERRVLLVEQRDVGHIEDPSKLRAGDHSFP